ncbi:putative transcription factor bHLH family [Helianthus annuus]|uniref:Transcription factor bHLH family n=2 Tax=Helianthus annuus TaxID=4232 RepID=A0A9K3NSG8_HELAN|nr:transcription factor ABORTED MICROSPORES isoform X2 [Helianthus annuus]XP_022028122.1 transcription factor ABORTED MICROSPORES isoform X2 [Helianthus annuus]KAF5810260.1 putative transcription factor bHLH family [Helianthus annuus]KAJ0588927.1 putative transcription factor bHLH family [Helianthus annuus]KAJ0796483.1 putative transcription factor bHLH family [Helianthus annuus]KAJ0926941.1 putative transcription factor bHLH family [Helianthus annuus]KAJ0931357.1 putative transcription facto
MEVIQEMMERLRSIVGPESWDYCVFWKPCKDQRVIEWVDCCCSGSNVRHMNGNGGEHDQQLLFQCKDVAFHHPTTDACHLLSLLPPSMPFDSGIYGQTMISNQPRWLNFSNSSDSNFCEENLGTKALIPVSIGLVELFVSKQIAEDQSIVAFVTDVFSKSLEQHSMLNTSNNVASSFSVNMDGLEDGESKDYIAQVLDDHKDPCNNFQPPISPATILENLNLSPHNISDNHMHPMNFLQHFNYGENRSAKNMFLEGTREPMMMNHDDPFDPSLEDNGGFDHEIDMALQGQMMSDSNNKGHLMDPLENNSKKQGNDVNRSDSVSDCSDQNDDDDDPKCRRRNGKPQSKNLIAERRRRKKLNDRLYTLRSLVPKITKLDRASILKDAIEYVMELKRQVEDLQNELEENSDDEDTTNNESTIVEQEVMHGNGSKQKRRYSQGHGMFMNGPQPEAYSVIGNNEVTKHNPDVDGASEKGQQMEPQVEVASLDGNEFFVKVFREHKPGGFVRLMEAFNSLGLEVTNVNVTSFRCLVLNVFKVERKDSEMVQADHVRESLLEITRNPSKGWPETSTKASENGHGMMDHHHHNHNHHHHSHLHNNQPKPQYHFNAMYQVLN